VSLLSIVYGSSTDGEILASELLISTRIARGRNIATVSYLFLLSCGAREALPKANDSREIYWSNSNESLGREPLDDFRPMDNGGYAQIAPQICDTVRDAESGVFDRGSAAMYDRYIWPMVTIELALSDAEFHYDRISYTPGCTRLKRPLSLLELSS
jgi:hypothetical protein